MATFKEVLSKLPEKKRTQFLTKMVFGKGRIVNIDFGPVGDQISGRDAMILMQACGCTTVGYACTAYKTGECFASKDSACDASACGKSGGKLIAVADMVKDVPDEPRRNFLDSIDFSDGKLIAAKSSDLKEHIKDAKTIKRLPKLRK